MKKPTIEDLERIRNEFQEMMQYFVDISDNRDLTDGEINVFTNLSDCKDYCGHAIFYLPDLREGVIDDC